MKDWIILSSSLFLMPFFRGSSLRELRLIFLCCPCNLTSRWSVCALIIKVKLPRSTPWRHIVGVEVQLHSLLTSTLDGREWLTSRLHRFTYSEESTDGLDVFWEEKNHFFLPEFELRTSQTVAHRVWFDFQHIEDNFSLLLNVEICFQPSVQWIPGVKESQLEAEHSNPSIDKIRNEWRCTSILTHMPSFYAQEKLDVFANANLVSCHKIT